MLVLLCQHPDVDKVKSSVYNDIMMHEHYR
jgi:hypothetical protein